MSDSPDMHIPDGTLINSQAGPVLNYVIHLDIASPEAIQQQLQSILNLKRQEWSETSFSGIVHIQCIHDSLDDYGMQVVGGMIENILSSAQGVIEQHHMQSADQHPIRLQHSLSHSLTPRPHS